MAAASKRVKSPATAKRPRVAQLSADQTTAADGSTTATAPLELVFGLVGPIGVDLIAVQDALTHQLQIAGYEAFEVRLSDLILGATGHKPDHTSEFSRIVSLINDGNSLCANSGQADIIARLGLTAIRDIRQRVSENRDKPSRHRRIAYIVRSLKRKEEVELFRNTYGRAFSLVSVYASQTSRHQALTKRFRGSIQHGVKGFDKNVTPEELATHAMERDYEEEANAFGQRVGKTFPLADFFVTTEPRRDLDDQLRRLVRLTLGDPFISPTREEQGMFFAKAAAVRSLDLSRQVGAAIISQSGDVLATGCNEVPKSGGGLYWASDKNSTRDFEFGEDANVTVKIELIEDALQLLRDAGYLSDKEKRSDRALAEELLLTKGAVLRKSKVYDVIEFGRAVHAEMAAISQAARNGIAVREASLFCTTFPCHICARHIVAAGIADVYFIEPYEKSRTGELYSDSICIEPHEPSNSRVNFRAFVGVAPRRYIEYFQMETDRKGSDGKVLKVPLSNLQPKFKRFVFTYINVEQYFVRELEHLLAKAKSSTEIAK